MAARRSGASPRRCMGVTTIAPLLLLLSLSEVVSQGFGFRTKCSLLDQPVATLRYDPATGKHTVIDHGEGGGGADEGVDESGGRALTRNLDVTAFAHSGDGRVGAFSSASVGRRTDAAATSAEPTTYKARYCPCAWAVPWTNDAYYCPYPLTDMCGVSSRGGYVGCYESDKRVSFSRSVWPVILVLYSLLLTALCTTNVGRNATAYPVSLCWKGWNRRIVLRRMEELRRREIRWREMDRERRRREEGWVSGYVLKTKRYGEKSDAQKTGPGGDMDADGTGKNASTENATVAASLSPSASQDPKPTPLDEAIPSANDFFPNEPFLSVSSHEHEHTCAICILPIQHGDRIGDLRCGHHFHVDCLKPWIKRRNACPLCNGPEIAEERREFETAQEGECEEDEDGGGARRIREGRGEGRDENRNSGGRIASETGLLVWDVGESALTRLRAAGIGALRRLRRRPGTGNNRGGGDDNDEEGGGGHGAREQELSPREE